MAVDAVVAVALAVFHARQLHLAGDRGAEQLAGRDRLTLGRVGQLPTVQMAAFARRLPSRSFLSPGLENLVDLFEPFVEPHHALNIAFKAPATPRRDAAQLAATDALDLRPDFIAGMIGILPRFHPASPRALMAAATVRKQ